MTVFGGFGGSGDSVESTLPPFAGPTKYRTKRQPRRLYGFGGYGGFGRDGSPP